MPGDGRLGPHWPGAFLSRQTRTGPVLSRLFALAINRRHPLDGTAPCRALLPPVFFFFVFCFFFFVFFCFFFVLSRPVYRAFGT